MTGDLTLHGVTKSVTVKMTMTGSGEGMHGEKLIGFEGNVSIMRSDFGMKSYLPGLGDEVRLTLGFEGAKK